MSWVPDGADGFGSFSCSGGGIKKERSREVVHHLWGGAVVEPWGGEELFGDFWDHDLKL